MVGEAIKVVEEVAVSHRAHLEAFSLGATLAALEVEVDSSSNKARRRITGTELEGEGVVVVVPWEVQWDLLEWLQVGEKNGRATLVEVRQTRGQGISFVVNHMKLAWHAVLTGVSSTERRQEISILPVEREPYLAPSCGL